MEATLPLDKMTVAEKLRAMEMLWADLSRNEVQIESPAWHKKILKSRLAKIESGKGEFLTLAQLKKRLAKRA